MLEDLMIYPLDLIEIVIEDSESSVEKHKRQKFCDNYAYRYIWFFQHQEKTTYGLVYKLTLTKNSDNSVLNKHNSSKIG